MYDAGASAGEEVLARVSGSKFWGEGYKWHILLSGAESSGVNRPQNAENVASVSAAAVREREDWVLVCTFTRLILVRRFTLVWEIPLTDIIMDSLEIVPDVSTNAVTPESGNTFSDNTDAELALPPQEEMSIDVTEEDPAGQHSLVSFTHLPRTKYSEDPDRMTQTPMLDMVLERRVIRCGSRTRSRRVFNLLRRRRGVPLLPARRYTEGTDQVTDIADLFHESNSQRTSKNAAPGAAVVASSSSRSFGGEGKEAHAGRRGVGEDNHSGFGPHTDDEAPGGDDVGPEGRASPGSFLSPRRPE
jgi:hypothetical protein